MSEPIFEASVRLRADTADFEAQAQASLKDVVSRLETQTATAVRNAQRPIAQTPPALVTPQVLAPEVPPIPPVEVPMKLVPPVEVPPVEVPVTVLPPDVAALEQQLAQARALAERPVSLDVIANTRPFEREVNVAYQRAVQLAEQNVASLTATSVSATRTSEEASKALLQAAGFEARQQAQVVAEASADAAQAARIAVDDAKSQLNTLLNEQQAARLAPANQALTTASTAGVRAETAGILGDQAAQDKQLLEQEIAARQYGLETLQLKQDEFAETLATGAATDRDALLARAENAAAASTKLRNEIAALQSKGLSAIQPPAPPGGPPGDEGGGGALGGIRDIFRHETSGRTSGLLGLLGGGLRFGVAGFAFTAAFESLRELQGLLRADGDEAFTMEGRIRNLGAELVGGNFIGGIKALTANQKATFVGGLAEELEKLKLAGDDTAISLDKIESLQRGRGFTRTEEYKAADKALRDLGDSADGFVAAQLETVKAEESASTALKEYVVAQTFAGHISEEQAGQILKVAANFDKQQEFAGLAAAALDDYTRAVARAGSESARFGREGGLEGLRGPGRVASQGVAAGQGAPGAVTGQQTTGIPRPIVTNPFLNPVFRAPDQAVGAATRDALAARLQDDQERLAAQLKNLQVTQQQKRTAFEEAKAAKEVAEKAGDASAEARIAAAAYSDLVQATTDVGAKAAELAATTKANVEATQAAASRTRDARAAQITDPGARLQAELGNARIDEQTAAAAAASAARAAEHAKKGSAKAREAAEAQATYEEAVARRAGVEQEIASNQQAAAEAARQDARGAEEARLANNIAAAALTPLKADDKRFYNEAIAYYKQVAADASETKTAREQARGTVRELVAGRKAALQGDAGDPAALRQQLLNNALARAEQAGDLPATRRAAQKIVDYWEEQVKSTKGIERAQAQASLIGARGQRAAVDDAEQGLAEQRIRNRISAAQLTKGLGDDKKAADALVDYYQKAFDNAKGAQAKVKARADLISAQLARQALDNQKDSSTGAGGIGTLDFLGISKRLQQDFAGNLLPTGGRSAMDQLFGAAGGQLPQSGGPEEEQVDELRRIRQLLERNGTGATVTVNQHHAVPDASGFAQARWARFAMEEAFNG